MNEGESTTDSVNKMVLHRLSNMRFNLSQLLKESVGASRVFTFNETFKPIAETGSRLARGKIRVVRIDRGIWVTGSIDTNIVLECGRSAEIVDLMVSLQLDEEYEQSVDINTGKALKVWNNLEIKEGKFTLDSNHTLDLNEAIRQYAIINTPLKPLCCKNCLGLCFICGTNLNKWKCDCSVPGDPRWELLRGLLGIGKNNS